MDDFALRQLNNTPFNVHGTLEGVLDLVLSNVPSAFTTVHKAAVEFNSDHNVLSFERTIMY